MSDDKPLNRPDLPVDHPLNLVDPLSSVPIAEQIKEILLRRLKRR